MRRQRRPGQPPVASREEFWHLFCTPAALPDFQQGSGNRADHVLKKAAATNPEDPFCPGPVPACLIDGPDPVLGLRSRRTKRREIMISQKIACTAVQCVFA